MNKLKHGVMRIGIGLQMETSPEAGVGCNGWFSMQVREQTKAVLPANDAAPALPRKSRIILLRPR